MGDLTKVHPETVRRYMTGQVPSTEFLIEVAEATSVNVGWLLTGDGPMYRKDIKLHALRDANPTELLHAVAQTLEALIERVDRIERFVMTLDTRVRVMQAGDNTNAQNNGVVTEGGSAVSSEGLPSGSAARTAVPISSGQSSATNRAGAERAGRATAIVDGIFPPAARPRPTKD